MRSHTYCLIICWLFLSSHAWSGPYYTVQKTKTINKFYSLVSNWINQTTYQTILNYMDICLLDPLQHGHGKQNCSVVGNDALTTLTTSLTIPQYQQFTAWITALTLQLGPTGIIQATSILKNALWNNLCPFFGQLSTWLNVNQGRLTEAGAVANVYRLVNEFLTFNRTKTIILRVQADLANAGMWTQIRNSAIGDWILFSQYGC